MASWWTSADMLDSLDLEENSIVSRVIQAVGLFGDILSLEDTMEPMLSEVGSRDEAVKRPEEKMVIEDGKGEDPEVEDWRDKDESKQKNMTIEGSDGGHTDLEKHEMEGMNTKVKEKQDTEGEEEGTGKEDLRNEGKKDEGSMEQEQEIKREEECKEGRDEDEVEEKEEMVEEDKKQGRERGEEEQDEEEENEVKEEEERDEVDGSDKEKTRGHPEKERREEDRKEEEQMKVERDEEEERGLNKENNEVLGEDIETHDEEEDEEENIMKESGDDGEEKEERHEEEQLDGRGEKELEDKEEKEHDMEEKQVDKEKEVVQEEVKETEEDSKEENIEEVVDREEKMEKEEAERENKEKEEEIMKIEEIMEGKKEEVGEKEEKMEGKEDVEEKEEEIVGKEVKMKEKEEEKENKNQDVGRKEEVMEGEELKVDENKDQEVGRKEDMETVAGQNLDFAGTLSADIAETGGGAHTVTSDEEKGSDSARDDEDIRLTSLSKHKEPQAFLSCTDASTQTAASEQETDTNLPSEDDSRDAAPRPQTDLLTSGCRPKKRVTLMDTAAQSSTTGAQRGNDGLGPTQHSPATGEPDVEGKERGEKIPKVNGEGDDKKSSDRQSSKYKTVSYRRIRRGNTKLRIDEFEAMINS